MLNITENDPSPGEVTIQIDKDIFTRFMNVKVDGKEYSFLGAGSFNIAYKSTTAPYEVYKEPFFKTEFTDLPDRAVRLWNDINPTMPARIANQGKGWIAPFVSGTSVSDQEISNAIIDIYMNTGRVVVDAFVKSNFIKMNNDAVACIDIGLALQLENRLEKAEEQSKTSLGFWNTRGRMVYDNLLPEQRNVDPLITNTIKALLCLRLYQPDNKNLEFLKNNAAVIRGLANEYTNKNENHISPAPISKQSDSIQSEYLAAQKFCKTPDDVKKLSDAFAALQNIESNYPKLSPSSSSDDKRIHARLVFLKRKIEFKKTIYEIRERNGKNYSGFRFFRKAGQSAGEKCMAAHAMLQELDSIEKFLINYGTVALQPLTPQTEQIKKAIQQGKLGELYREVQEIKKEAESGTPSVPRSPSR